ncbi:MAG TPA: SRPBCC domain-containing protein [Bacteroidota bacterium]|nr:SRPBCC domain-containing protein [Bacteroidota bacterium]
MKSTKAKKTPSKTKVIRQKAAIPASPEEVFDAYMDSRVHAEFTGGGKATVSRKVGGTMTAWDGYISGKNLELVRGKRILQEWITTDWLKDDPVSILDLRLSKKGNGTELTMIHSEVPARLASSLAKGWKDYYWKLLKRYFQERNKK